MLSITNIAITLPRLHNVQSSYNPDSMPPTSLCQGLLQVILQDPLHEQSPSFISHKYYRELVMETFSTLSHA